MKRKALTLRSGGKKIENENKKRNGQRENKEIKLTIKAGKRNLFVPPEWSGLASFPFM